MLRDRANGLLTAAMLNVPQRDATDSAGARMPESAYGTPMTAFAPARSRRIIRLSRAAAATLAAGALVAPHVLPGAEFRPLDAIAEQARTAGSADRDGASDNFPGSAYFFAEGAFMPEASVVEPSNPHIFALSTGPAAPAWRFRGATALDTLNAETCLTQAIYFEAGSEPEEGQRAVAQVVLNRVRSPAYPNSVCGVVFQDSARTDHKCQFTFACDGSLARQPSRVAWNRAARIAREALAGISFGPVGMSTHYHTLAVNPFWSSSLQQVAVVGAHIFYRPHGGAGMPAAFTAAYAGREPTPGRHQPAIARSTVPIEPPMAWVPPTLLSKPSGPPPQPLSERLPQSNVRPEYLNSGRPLI